LIVFALLAVVGAQAALACPTGTFSCTCNGVVSCQHSIQGCFDSCVDLAPAPGTVATPLFLNVQQPAVADMMLAQIMAPAESAPAADAVFAR
jgi:hypothetical protein